MPSLQPVCWRGTEAVITALTRNQMDGFAVTWVRIPPSPNFINDARSVSLIKFAESWDESPRGGFDKFAGTANLHARYLRAWKASAMDGASESHPLRNNKITRCVILLFRGARTRILTRVRQEIATPNLFKWINYIYRFSYPLLSQSHHQLNHNHA